MFLVGYQCVKFICFQLISAGAEETYSYYNTYIYKAELQICTNINVRLCTPSCESHYVYDLNISNYPVVLKNNTVADSDPCHQSISLTNKKNGLEAMQTASFFTRTDSSFNKQK